MIFTKETFKRLARTFLQTALGYIVVNLALVDFTGETDVVKSAVVGLCVSAVAAGAAAVMNLEKASESEGE